MKRRRMRLQVCSRHRSERPISRRYRQLRDCHTRDGQTGARSAQAFDLVRFLFVTQESATTVPHMYAVL